MFTQAIESTFTTLRLTEDTPGRSLRLAQMADIPALQTLVEQAVRHLGGRDYTPLQVSSSLKYIFGVDTQLISDGTYYVVEIGNKIVGAGG